MPQTLTPFRAVPVEDGREKRSFRRRSVSVLYRTENGQVVQYGTEYLGFAIVTSRVESSYMRPQRLDGSASSDILRQHDFPDGVLLGLSAFVDDDFSLR